MAEYRDKETLNTFAKIAADEYLGSNKAPLNSTLKKIASQEHLTPHQIEYVTAEANKAVWGKLFSMDKQASYDFPLADSKDILKDLQVSQAPKEVKIADLDYLSPPISTKVASFDPFQALGVVEDNVKTASAKKEVKRELKKRLEKVAQAREDLERELFVVNSKIELLELDFVKAARSMVLEHSFAERGAAMDKVAEFLRGCSEKPEHNRALIKKLAHVMKRQGLVKEADLKAPEEYISDKLPCRIVNGRHQLSILVKTIMDQYDQRDVLHNRYEIVDSSLPVIKEKIREL